jgi:hypothetical protein
MDPAKSGILFFAPALKSKSMWFNFLSIKELPDTLTVSQIEKTTRFIKHSKAYFAKNILQWKGLL